MTDRELTNISKQMSYLLRHSDEYIDRNGGWAWVEEIIMAVRERHPAFGEAELKRIVAEDEKGRYSFDASGTKIRANQGHSVPGVEVEMEEPVPPEVLYHGTAVQNLPSIFREGLKPMTRLFVHISTSPETARTTGQRHGKPVVLCVATGQMYRDGIPLKRSMNGIWQAKTVPPQYLSLLEAEKKPS